MSAEETKSCARPTLLAEITAHSQITSLSPASSQHSPYVGFVAGLRDGSLQSYTMGLVQINSTRVTTSDIPIVDVCAARLLRLPLLQDALNASSTSASTTEEQVVMADARGNVRIFNNVAEFGTYFSSAHLTARMCFLDEAEFLPFPLAQRGEAGPAMKPLLLLASASGRVTALSAYSPLSITELWTTDLNQGLYSAILKTLT